MTKYTLVGILACIGGGVLVCFQAVSSAMGAKSGWQNLKVGDLFGEEYIEWTAGLSPGTAEGVVEYIADLPLFVLLFFVGCVFFVLDYFLGRR